MRLVTVYCSCVRAVQSDEPNIYDTPVGLLLISGSSTDAIFFSPEKIALVLEEVSKL